MSSYQPFPPSHRFSEQSFRRYETAIQTILLNYPNPTLINPLPFSCETFCARIRDAITAFLSYEHSKEWQSNVDRILLERVRPDIIFTHDGTQVTAGPRAALKTDREKLVGGSVKASRSLPQFQTSIAPIGTSRRATSRHHSSAPQSTLPSVGDSHSQTDSGHVGVAGISSLLSGVQTHSPSEADLLGILQRLSTADLVGPITLTGTIPLTLLETVISDGLYDVEYKTNPDQSVVLF